MKARGHRGACALFALLALAAGRDPAVRAADVSSPQEGLRVAMMDFTTDDGLMYSAAGAAQWSLLTQPALAAQEPDVQWTERAQLQLASEELRLSAGGFTSVAGALQAGRWLKADVAILGRFLRNEHDEDGHTLRLEIIDLDHADTLAVRTVPVPGDRRETITPDAGSVKTTAAVLHEALAEARAARSRHADRRVVAPLFFRNADPSPRLDGFGPALVDALTRSAEHSPDVRAVRFPQADQTRNEAALVVGGFTDAEERRRLADLYVWGQYRELPAEGIAFAQTPVEIELTLWDGANSPQHLAEKATVAELPALAERLTSQCLDAARRAPADRAGSPSSDAMVRSVASLLRTQGDQIASGINGYGTRREAFLDTAAGKKLAAQAQLLLETACFFAPDDRAAQASRLHWQWGGFPMPVGRPPLLDLWHCANEVAALVERFEATGEAGDLRGAPLHLDALLLYRLEGDEANLHQPNRGPGLPVDVSDSTVALWHHALDERFARDAEAFARAAGKSSAPSARAEDYSFWLRVACKVVHDPGQGVRAVEALWPSYQPLYRQDPEAAERFHGRGESLSYQLRKLYLRQHQSERAEILLAALPAGETPSRVTAPAPAAPAAGLPVLTPVVRTPRYTPAPPDGDNPGSGRAVRQVTVLAGWSARPGFDVNEIPRYTVRALTPDGKGGLWMSILREKGFTEKLAPAEESQELVRFDPGSGTFQPAPVPGLTTHPAVVAVFPAGDNVWLAQDFTGLLRYDPATSTVTRRYTVADGLATANLDAGATDDAGRTYFVGHEQDIALVQEYDQARQEWHRVGPPTVDCATTVKEDAPAFLRPSAAQLAIHGRWLLSGFGVGWTLLDRAGGEAGSLRGVLKEMLPAETPTVAKDPARMRFTAGQRLSRTPRLCGADAGGFWLASEDKIIRFDPAHPEAAKSWPLPAELPFGATALAPDGENLWVVGPSGKVHPPTEPPAALAMQLPANMSTPMFGRGRDGRGFVACLCAADGQWRGGFEVNERVSSLAVTHDRLYLGLATAPQPLIEIDKTGLLTDRLTH